MSDPSSFFASARRAIDRYFAAWAGIVADHPWPIIGVAFIALLLVLPATRFVEVTTNSEDFLMADHPVRLDYQDFKNQFGSDNYVLITLRHEELFTNDFLEWLAGLHGALEARVPYLAEVTSLVNIRSTRGDGDRLIVEDLLEDWPADRAALAELARRVESNPLYRRVVLSDDRQHTTIQIEVDASSGSSGATADLAGFDEDKEFGLDARNDPDSASVFSGNQELEIIAVINEVLREFARPDVDVYVAGTPYSNARLVEDMRRNMILFVLLSTFIVGVVLWIIFRRLVGILLPLIVVSGAMGALLGIIVLRDQPVNMTIQILPSFLLAVGSSSSIHLLVIFFQYFDRSVSRRDSLVEAMSHAASPIALACITTAVGFASFLVADVAPVRDLGVMAPVGILSALVLCLTVLPALLMVMPIRKRPSEAGSSAISVGRVVSQVGDLGYRHPWTVLIGMAFIVSVSLIGAVRVRFEHNIIKWFPERDPIHLNTRVADTLMSGTMSAEVVIDTGIENGIHEPKFQESLEAYERLLVESGIGEGRVRKTISVNGVLREIHQALNENDPSFYRTPNSRALIAQEFLLFENSGSDDLEKFVDSSFQTARVSVRSTQGGGAEYLPYLARIEDAARRAFPNSDVKLTGLIPILMNSLLEIQASITRSYSIALMTITPLMMLLIGSLRGGFASMVPNLSPIAIVIGFMGWVGIPFDIFTILTGSIAIGLAVDDTIHFMHGFYREFEKTGDTRASIAHTLETTGAALLTTSLVLAVGFSVFLLATMSPLQNFGLITAMAILLAFLADILVAPALVTIATRRRS